MIKSDIGRCAAQIGIRSLCCATSKSKSSGTIVLTFKIDLQFNKDEEYRHPIFALTYLAIGSQSGRLIAQTEASLAR